MSICMVRAPFAVLALACSLTLPVAAHESDQDRLGSGHDNGFGRQKTVFDNHVLVSDGSVPADVTDPNLINAWGVVFNPTGVVWVNAADAGKSLLFDGTGKPQSLVVTVPGLNGEMGHPTGIVFSGGADFVVHNTTATGPARFMFATEDGTIAGWAPNVDVNNAITVVDNTGVGASYRGLASSGDGSTHLLYATDFHNARIDVFDGTFKPVQVPGGFRDRFLPRGYAPFGIQAINGDIYVTYGKQNSAADEEEKGPGLGIVNVFDPQGRLIQRLVTHGALNAPWGLALAPASFGDFGGAILVGNFGDGHINAYGPRSGKFLGALRGADHRRLSIEGLWGLAFGNGVQQQKTNSLFYAAGPNDEASGVYGVIDVVH
ncbi:TIGR03118 family protein [Povalibacter sp.]|uniref:TIGR03118 family protein n=1 Tax=Povalibacter sp. TaxID=1962978 RepID=UPI002F3FFFAD